MVLKTGGIRGGRSDEPGYKKTDNNREAAIIRLWRE